MLTRSFVQTPGLLRLSSACLFPAHVMTMPFSFAASGVWDEPISTADGPEKHEPLSDLRSRILEESRAFNRKGPRKPTWTKQPKYEGYQSTLDLNNDLQALPPSSGSKGRHQTTLPASGSTCNDNNMALYPVKHVLSTTCLALWILYCLNWKVSRTIVILCC
jgi:hypothetical protein